MLGGEIDYSAPLASLILKKQQKQAAKCVRQKEFQRDRKKKTFTAEKYIVLIVSFFRIFTGHIYFSHSNVGVIQCELTV